jgi:hypothetical protein
VCFSAEGRFAALRVFFGDRSVFSAERSRYARDEKKAARDEFLIEGKGGCPRPLDRGPLFPMKKYLLLLIISLLVFAVIVKYRAIRQQRDHAGRQLLAAMHSAAGVGGLTVSFPLGRKLG